MKIFPYHWVPDVISGSILKPLNELKISDPVLYQEKVKKYEGRERLLQRRIPILNCLWNDVIFLTPFHPAKLTDGLKKAGWNRPIARSFEIDPKSLDLSKTVIWFYSREDAGWDPSEYVAFDATKLEKYQELPQATLEYFKRCKTEKLGIPFSYHLAPHVLYLGEIETHGLKIVDG